MLLHLLNETYAICELDPTTPLPDLHCPEFLSVVRSDTELSIVCPESAVPPLATANYGWRALRVMGPLSLKETGILASLAQPLAAAGIPIIAISTYATDYFLVPQVQLDATLHVLRKAGHDTTTATPPFGGLSS